MQVKLSKYLRYTFYSFPIQLLLLHTRKHTLLLLFWIILFGIALQGLGVNYGIPLLLLDPEYLGKVGMLSFLIVGFTMGGFFMAWNMSSYLLNNFRFEFLASSESPFVQYCLNNSLIPLAFTITYIVKLIQFQSTEIVLSSGAIALNVLVFLLGVLLNILFTGLVFVLLNQDVEIFLEKMVYRIRASFFGRLINIDKLGKNNRHDCEQWPVQTYLRFPFKISLVRKVDFYNKEFVDKVLYQYNRSTFLFQILTMIALIAFGKLMDITYFRMPAMSAMLLIFSVTIVFFSFFTYWFGEWRMFIFIVLILILNGLTRFDLIVYKHHLYGLNYKTTKLEYNNKVVNDAVNEKTVNIDIANTTQILNNWQKNMRQKYGEEKPKIVFINTAGGGLKAAYWSFYLLQELEKSTGKKLFDHSILITGASGGMFGAAYFRELYLQHHQQKHTDYLDAIYLKDVGKDILNSVATSIATNDIFYPWQTYTYKSLQYKKDRAYMFDKQFNENTNYRLSKLLTDYKTPEQEASIPMMIVASTIINDQRFLLFSPQGISYMLRPYIRPSQGFIDRLSTDAVEYMRFFKDRGSENTNFVDVLRTNATYPYILPVVYLPTNPEIKTLDAGIRDNTGVVVSTRFYSVFKDWIETHTSGAIFITLRVSDKFGKFDTHKKPTLMAELLSPSANIYSNFQLLQNYNGDISFVDIENASKTPVDVLNFNYYQSDIQNKASMSLHLTNGEKKRILSAFKQSNNLLMQQKLIKLLH